MELIVKSRYCAPCVVELPDRKILIESPEDVINVACLFFKLSREELISSCRQREIAFARQCAMRYIRENLRVSLLSTGKLFGSRDHTTVIHAVKTLKNLCYVDERIRLQYWEFEDAVKRYLK